MNIPSVDSVWRRKDNHNQYQVLDIANQRFKGKHKKDFPITVIFFSKTKILATTLEKFNELMEEMPNGR